MRSWFPETKSAIEANPTFAQARRQPGIREMACEIDRKSEADYRLFRFDGERELPRLITA